MTTSTAEANSKLMLVMKTDKNSKLPLGELDVSFGVAVNVSGRRVNIYTKPSHPALHKTQKDVFQKTYWKVQCIDGQKAPDITKAINDAIHAWQQAHPDVIKAKEASKASQKGHVAASTTNAFNHRTMSVLTLTGSVNLDTHEDVSGSLPVHVGEQTALAPAFRHIRNKSSVQLCLLFQDTEPFRFDDDTCQATSKGMVLNGSPFVLYVTRQGARYHRIPLYKDVPLDDFYLTWSTDQPAEDVDSVFRETEAERYKVFCELMDDVKTSSIPVIAVFRFLKSATERPAVFGTLLIKWMTGKPLTSTVSRQVMLTQQSLIQIGLLDLPCTELTLLPSDVLQPYESMHKLIFNSPKRAITHYKSNSNSAFDYADTVLAEEIKRSHPSSEWANGLQLPAVATSGPTTNHVSHAPLKGANGKPEKFVVGAPANLSLEAQAELSKYLAKLKLTTSPSDLSPSAILPVPFPIAVPLEIKQHTAEPALHVTGSHSHSSSAASGTVGFCHTNRSGVLNQKEFNGSVDRRLNEGYGFCFDAVAAGAHTDGKHESSGVASGGNPPKHLFRCSLIGESLSGFPIDEKVTLVRFVEKWRATFRVINEAVKHLQELDSENSHSDRELMDVQAEHYSNNVPTLMNEEKTRWDRFFNPLVLSGLFRSKSFALIRLFRQPVDTLAPLVFGDVLVNFGPPLSDAESALASWRDTANLSAKISIVVHASTVLDDVEKARSVLDYNLVYSNMFKSKPTVWFGLRNDWTQEADEQARTSSLLTKHFVQTIQTNQSGIGKSSNGSVDMGKRLQFLTHRTNRIKDDLTRILSKKPGTAKPHHHHHTHHEHHRSSKQQSGAADSSSLESIPAVPNPVLSVTPDSSIVSPPLVDTKPDAPLVAHTEAKSTEEQEESEEEEEEEEEEKEDETDIQMTDEEAIAMGFDSVEEVKTMIAQVEIAYDKAKEKLTAQGKDTSNRSLLELTYRQIMQKDILLNLKPDSLRERLGVLYKSGALRHLVKLFHPNQE